MGDKYRLAFVTSTTRDATDVLIGPYNDFVTAVANGVPELLALGTTWTAIGSTSAVDARDNTGTNPSATGVPIYRLDGERIADHNADLWDGSLIASLSIEEEGFQTLHERVWTGSLPEGTALPGLVLGMSSAGAGTPVVTNPAWIFTSVVDFSNPHPLYVMSGELTVIPEPSSMMLVCIGATAVVGWQLRRRRHRRRP